MVFQIKSINFAIVIELERHIEILLLKSDCVIVPGLGGFVASHVGARYDEGDNMFIPPLRTLGFNPKLNVNDSLLAQSYSEAYDISYPEACVRIDDEVDELKQIISNNGSYDLGGIGTLYLNGDGNLEFTPCEAGILTPGLYSLSSFEMKRVCAPDSVRRDKRDAGGVTAQVIPFTPPEAVNAVRPDGNEDNGRILQIRVSAVRNFVAAVVAVVLFLLLGTPVNENCGGVRTSNIYNGVIQNLINNGYNSLRHNKSIDLRPETKKRDSVKAEAVVKAQPVKREEAVADSFYIVIASRVTKKNADEYVSRLVSRGYGGASVLVGENRSVKVVYGHYASEGEAYGALGKLRGDDIFRDAWVYRVRN